MRGEAFGLSCLRFLRLATVLALLGSGLAACGSSSGSSSAGASASGPSKTTQTDPPKSLTSVKVALDWTPNTNHTGIFVADRLGYYKDAGIDVNIVPYGNTPVETLLGTNQVQFGVSYEDGLTLARAAGQKLTAVYVILQKPDIVIGVRANRTDITSPKDLDGKTYAGFGIPYEKPFLQTVIRNAGGTGKFNTISLSTSAYDAVWSGHADFDMPEPTWEVIEARLLGKPFKTFNPYQYGAPPAYTELVAASDAVIAQDPGLVTRFVAATAKGYQYAINHPAQAAKILLEMNSQALKNPKLVDESQALESTEYYPSPTGHLGWSNPAQWKRYTAFLEKNRILKDSSGQTITTPFNSAQLFTNRFLPAATG